MIARTRVAPSRSGRARRGSHHLRVAAVALAACALLVACDGADVTRPGIELAEPGALSMTSSDVADGVHAGRGAIRVTFDRPLDVQSVGARSVRIVRTSGRRVRRVRAWASGRDVFVAAAPGAELPARTDLVLRIEGGGSPRALRALDGSVLEAPVELPFRALRRRRTDLEGPALVASRPASGATGVRPGGHVQLVFDEPLSRAAIRRGEAIALRIDGRSGGARVRLSPDLTRVVVRASRPIPPGASVEVLVSPGLLDLAGNPARPATVRFRTAATRLRELSEDFVTTDLRDARGTTGGWAEPEAPGFLVARAGRLRWSAVGDESPLAVEAVPAAETVRFQVLLPADAAPGGIASAVRVYLIGARTGDELPAARASLGPTALVRLDPTSDANRQAASLVEAAAAAERLPVELDEGSGAPYVEIPFDLPVPLRPRAAALLDVALVLPVGVQVAAVPDAAEQALVEHLGVGDLLPAAEVLVSGGPPQARSAWRDSGALRPGWRTAVVVGPNNGADDVFVEYQTAASAADGRPDPARASEWSEDLARLPSLRFVRFRVTFMRLGRGADAPRIDRIVLPFQE